MKTLCVSLCSATLARTEKFPVMLVQSEESASVTQYQITLCLQTIFSERENFLSRFISTTHHPILLWETIIRGEKESRGWRVAGMYGRLCYLE